MIKMLRPVALSSIVLLAFAIPWEIAAEALPASINEAPVVASQLSLHPVSIVRVEKTGGEIDQVIPTPDDGFIIRDYNWELEETQAIDLYDSAGRHLRKIGRFGRIPGTYFRLKKIALDRSGHLWVADVQGRVSRFDLQGNFLDSFLIQRPGYRVKGLALDEERGTFYLLGCLPRKTYLDEGCLLVHKYDISGNVYRESFIDTDPEAMTKNLLPLEDYRLDIAEDGTVFFTDAPLMKLFRLDPESGDTAVFPVRSRFAKTAGVHEKGSSMTANMAARASAHLIDRVLVSGTHVIVSIRRPYGESYLLQILDTNGDQLAVDLESPGRLVGKTRGGDLLFTPVEEGRFEVTTYELRASGPRL